MKKINFKKISALGASLIMTGATLGLAAAANYPAPFVSGSTSNVAIVYGTGSGVSSLDLIQAGNIQTDLQSRLGSSTTSTTTSISGEGISLDSGSTFIWLNTSLNSAITTITKSDLPTILEQTTFSGNVDSKITSTITVGSNDTVTFAKQPSSSDDPVVGIAMSTSSSAPLYTASITMPAINFTSSDSEGETITLFGKDYVVSTSTDTTDLVLFSSAEQKTLVLGGSSPVPSTSVTVGGVDYTVELVSGSDTTATVSVSDGTTSEQKEVTEGSSKKINGLDVAVKSVDESTAINTITASLLLGSDKLTFTNATQVTKGSDDDPIDGTYVTFTGTTGALTGLSVAVYAPDSSSDAILSGDSFVDPVFGSFKVDFSGLNIPMDSSDRDTIKIDKSGDKGMSLMLTDSDGNEKTFDFIYNSSGSLFLGDSNDYTIANQEGATLYQNNYTMIGNEDYGHLLELTRIYNSSSSDYSKDQVTFKDVISGETYDMDATGEGSGRITIDGRQYTVTYTGTGSDATNTVTLKYPTSDSSSTQHVVFPTIKTQNGALIMLYEPQTIDNSSISDLLIPDGDGYTALDASTNGTTTIGQLTFSLTAGTLSLLNPSTNATISTPGVVIIEGKDDSSNYEALVAYTDESAGTSSDPVGIGTVVSTSPTWYTQTMQSDSDIVESMDWWGTLVTEDSNTASQKVVTISYPKEQVYANILVGGVDSAISGGTSSGSTALGDVLVKDSEVSSVSSKNLIVVGGSCINSAAAALVGGSYCGADFTTATGVGSGQFLIKGYSSSTLTSKMALLVAGYEAADTVNAATYLRTQTVDTGKEYLGTSATSATLQTESA